MNYQPVLHLVSLLHQLGVRQVVLAPGSRNAPLTLGFVRHKGFEIVSAPDERSAGYIALGLSLATQTPAIVCCTSGTAAANLLPAIAEADLQEVPLLAITADRPSEWIGQLDGQAMKQDSIYQNFVRGSWTLPSDYHHSDDLWFLNRVVNEAYLASTGFRKGPCHLNFPFREPFYPEVGEIFNYIEDARIIKKSVASLKLSRHQIHPYQKIWEMAAKKMIVIGQLPYNEELNNQLKALSSYDDVVVLADGPSNVFGSKSVISFSEIICKSANEKFQPDVLITLGLSVLSKPLKKFLREYKPQVHWHLQKHELVSDPFQSLTEWIVTEPASFIQGLGENAFFGGEKPKYYQKLWEEAAEKAAHQRDEVLNKNQILTDANASQKFAEALPVGAKVHLANSMPIRYFNLFQDRIIDQSIEVFSNRGVSGIDGCNSTAIGYSLASDSLNYLLSGDMAFFYDLNGFWIKPRPQNLKIVVLNNSGGNIFRMIPGPQSQPELSTYFETEQGYNLLKICQSLDIQALQVSKIEEIDTGFAWLNSTKGLAVLEIVTEKEQNAQCFQAITKPISL